MHPICHRIGDDASERHQFGCSHCASAGDRSQRMTGKFPNALGSAMLAAGVGPTKLAGLIGVTKQDVSRWSKQERKLPPAVATKIAPYLDTTAGALLMLEEPGAGGFKTVVDLGGEVGAGGRIDLSSEQIDPNRDYEAGIYASVPGAHVCYQVHGDSMRPRFLPGNLIICAQKETEFDYLLGDEVVLGTVDGARYLKIIHHGSSLRTYHLESHNAPLMLDVEVEWVAEIVAIIPSKKWRKLQRSNHPTDWSDFV